MAVAFVDATASVEADGNAVATLTVTGTTSTTGNAYVATCAVYDPDGTVPASFTVADNKGNTYGAIVSREFGVTADDARLEAHFAKVVTGGASHTVTLTIGDTGCFATMGIHELSGDWAGLSVPSDAFAGTNNAKGSSTAPSPGAVTPTANGLMFGTCSYDGSSTTIAVNTGTWTGATERLEIDENNDIMAQNTATNSASSGVAQTPTWTLGASRNWGAIGWVIKDVPSVGGATRGTPFGHRGTAFNGGRALQGPLMSQEQMKHHD